MRATKEGVLGPVRSCKGMGRVIRMGRALVFKDGYHLVVGDSIKSEPI